jgi:hypothetical protein
MRNCQPSQALARAAEGLARLYRGSPSEGLMALERGHAIARELANVELLLCVLLYRAEGLLAVGRWDEAEDALGQVKLILLERGRQAPDGRLARLETRLVLERLLAEGPELTVPAASDDVTRKLDQLLADARAREDEAGLAHALRWQAAWQLQRGELEATAATIVEALSIAEAGGLQLLGAELYWLYGRLMEANERPEDGAVGFEEGRRRAAAIGYRWLEAVCQPGLAAIGRRSHTRKQALERLRSLAAGLTGPDLAAFLGRADHRELLRGQVGDEEVDERPVELPTGPRLLPDIGPGGTGPLPAIALSRAELEVLARLALSTAGLFRLGDYFAAIAHEALPLAHAEQAYLLLGSELTCEAASDGDGALPDPNPPAAGLEACRRAYDHGEAVSIAAPSVAARALSDADHGALLAVPVAYQGRRLGALLLAGPRAGDTSARALGRLGELLGAFVSRRG